MPLGGFEFGMDILMGEEEEERFLLDRIQPFERKIRQDVCRVPLMLRPLSIHVKRGMVVHPLSTKTDPTIEPVPRRIVVVAHVPLSHERGLVARLLEKFGEEDGPFGDVRLVVHHAMPVRILSGQNGRAARRAEGGADEGVFKVDPLLGDTIHGGRLEEIGRPQEAHEVVTVVIAEDEDDVARSVLGLRGKPEAQCRDHQGEGPRPRPARRVR